MNLPKSFLCPASINNVKTQFFGPDDLLFRSPKDDECGVILERGTLKLYEIWWSNCQPKSWAVTNGILYYVFEEITSYEDLPDWIEETEWTAEAQEILEKAIEKLPE